MSTEPPATATASGARLVFARGARGLADGAIAVLLARHLASIGLDGARIGTLMTATLWGSAAATLLVGLFGHRFSQRGLLLFGAALMACTALGFFSLENFWLLMLIGAVGVINPSSGDVSFLLPTEQAALGGLWEGNQRVSWYARYSVAGRVGVALGAFLGGATSELTVGPQLRSGFVISLVSAVICFVIYVGLKLPEPMVSAPKRPLQKSRGIVTKLTLFFALDSAGGGFALESLLVLWLHQRFELSLKVLGVVFSLVAILNGLSQFLSVGIVRRFGMINTMVFSHAPANVFLILAALMPTAPLAIACLLLRACLTQMDVPARQAFVMSVVPPEERAQAASVTIVPRSFAGGLTPALAGMMLDKTSFGWPLICAGCLKIIYDGLMYVSFRKLKTS